MKKNICSIFASILCSATLLLGIAGCDTGAGEDDPIKGYNAEIPTTAFSLGADAFDGSVWDFSSFTAAGGTCGTTVISNEEIARDGKITASTAGTKETSLEFTNFKGKGNASTTLGVGYLQASKSSTANLTNLAGYQLTLTLATNSNIYIEAAGAGAAEAARYIAIADASDNVLISKDNLGNKATVDFQIQGAPAGAYKIYLNGAAIVKIDLSSAHKFALPPQINKLVLYKGDEVADKNLGSIEASIDTVKLGAWNVISDTNKVDLTEEAVWTSSNESVATVKAGTVTGVSAGKAIIRARIGRFYDERTVEVTPCKHTQVKFFLKKNIPATDTKVKLTTPSDDEKAKKLLKAEIVGNLITSAADMTVEELDSASWSDTGTSKGAEKGIEVKVNKLNDADLPENTEFLTLKFSVTPASGKTVKISGFDGFLGSGKGNNNLLEDCSEIPTTSATYYKVSVGDKAAFQIVPKTNGSAKATFANPVAISSQTEVVVTFAHAAKKNGISVDLMDLTLNVEE